MTNTATCEPAIECDSTTPSTLTENTNEPTDRVSTKEWVSKIGADAYGPDGGYGWCVVMGAFLGQFTSFGVSTSCNTYQRVYTGVMQDYFQQNTFSHVQDVQLKLSFAGTMMELFVNLMSPMFQVLSARYGVRAVLILATLFGVLGLEMAAFASQIWHLYLTQALFGVGASLMYSCAMSVPAQYFHRSRGLALGIASSGSGVGALVLPFILTALNNNLGVTWTYRIMGLICLVLNAITCGLVREKDAYQGNDDNREEQSPAQQPPGRKIFSFSVLTDINYVIWSFGSMISLMGFFVPFFYIPSYATYLGMSNADGTVFIAAVSAGNCVGRIGVGYIGDRIGCLNANILFTMISGISALTLWVFAYSYRMIMAFSIVFGLVCSSYVALLSPITATVLGSERFPTGISFLLLSNGVSIFGVNIASAIESRTAAEPYLTFKIFAGVTYIVGGLLLVMLKLRMTKSLLAKI